MATMRIGALSVGMSLDSGQFEAGAKRAQRTAAQTRIAFQKSFGGLGNIVKAGFAGVVTGLSIGLITRGVKAALDYAGSLAEVSNQLGVTTKDLQTFRYAAGQVGVKQEELEVGLKKLTENLGKVAAGAKQPIAALEAIGLNAEKISKLDTGDAFRAIADALEKVGSRSQRAAIELALFGKSGSKLDNLLAGGSSALNELSQAAERLGIVLSDEQIQKADQTADKLEAVKTMLSAQIAGVVADNADAILGLANALLEVAAAATKALGNFGKFVSFAAANVGWLANPTAMFAQGKNPLASNGNVKGFGVAGRSVTVSLPSPKAKAPTGGANIGKFLAGGGGGGKAKKDHSAEDAERKRQEALRDAFQFDQELLRAQQDVLRAQQSLATDYSERAALSIQMLNLDQQGFQREMEYAVASGDLSKAQAAQLEAEYTKKDALERQAVLAEEEAQRKEDYNHLEELDFDLQRDILQSQEQLADTAAEQRAIRLRLLDLDYRAERARLETVLADEKASYAAKEEARRRLLALNKTEANDRQGVINGTRGPIEDYLSRIPDTAEEWNESLEMVAANGLQAVEDGLVDILTGAKSVGEALRGVLKGILADLIRMQVKQLLAVVVGGFSDGGPVGFASGGWVSGRGTGSSDSIPAMLSNGEFVVNAKAAKRFMPLLETINAGNASLMAGGGIAIPSHSPGAARLNVANDDGPRGGMTVNMPLYFSGPVSRETMMQASAKVRAAVASANRKGA